MRGQPPNEVAGPELPLDLSAAMVIRAVCVSRPEQLPPCFGVSSDWSEDPTGREAARAGSDTGRLPKRFGVIIEVDPEGHEDERRRRIALQSPERIRREVPRSLDPSEKLVRRCVA